MALLSSGMSLKRIQSTVFIALPFSIAIFPKLYEVNTASIAKKFVNSQTCSKVPIMKEEATMRTKNALLRIPMLQLEQTSSH